MTVTEFRMFKITFLSAMWRKNLGHLLHIHWVTYVSLKLHIDGFLIKIQSTFLIRKCLKNIGFVEWVSEYKHVRFRNSTGGDKVIEKLLGYVSLCLNHMIGYQTTNPSKLDTWRSINITFIEMTNLCAFIFKVWQKNCTTHN